LVPGARAQSTFGSIVGVVKDPGEGSVAGAQITLTNRDDHTQRDDVADTNGGFEFVNLKPGHYDPRNLNLSYRGAFQRADCVGNGNIANLATGSMFHINAFSAIPAGPVGNCGVGILEGPGTSTAAAGLSKTVQLTERVRMRFESTFTNIFNHPNSTPPPTNVTSSSFGIVQNVQSA
jgi:hypothetical protein